jgi:2-polyprenyl-3-methyl-5-hydroxy-6-metoxy-1,4-benzoquinol methylase
MKNYSLNRLIINEFKRKIWKIKGKNIIKIGCGTSTTSIYLFKLGAKVSLVDISLNAIKLSKNIF